jgi:GNAT superfamily N-acetyltransferase
MTDTITIRPFTSADTAALLACWEQALPLDAITRDILETRLLLDDSYESGSLQLACLGDAIIGFITCFVLLKPIEKAGLRDDTGFITAFGIHQDHVASGAGEALLSAADEFFRSRNRRLALLSPYTPNYFVPGIDKDNYPHLLAMLQAHGYSEYSEALAADAVIATFTIPQKTIDTETRLQTEGIIIRHYQRDDLTAYMDFQRELMPGPWIEDARRNLRELAAGRFPADAIWLAIDTRAPGGSKIIGFCQHEHEHFGPFGVADAYQGKGIGTVLLARTLLQMRKKGCHSAWVLWTGQRALDGVYARLGFKLTRRFAIMKRAL